MSHSHARYHHSSSAPASGSSHHHQPSAAHYYPHEDPSPEPRRRRGRQARPTNLTAKMRAAVEAFCMSVGRPNVVDPAGFRDFRGWLAELNVREHRPHWEELISRIAREVKCDSTEFGKLKEDIVREIIKNVVVPRDQESSKLVSTNAGRQSGRPKSGTTLMLLLDQHFERNEKRLHELVSLYPPSAATSSLNAGASHEVRRPSSHHVQKQPHHRSSQSGNPRFRHSTLPVQHNRLRPMGIEKTRHPDERLPSFKELTSSIPMSMHHQRSSSSRHT